MASTNSTTTMDLNESRAGKVTTVIIFCPALAVVMVALRLYSQFVLGKRRFLEDYFIVLAMIFSIAMSVCMGISVLHGFGRHIQTVTPQDITTQLKVGIGGILTYLLTHLFIKLSILFQYLQISVMRFEKRLCYVVISFVVLQSTTWCVLTVTRCSPFEALWNRHVPGAKCINTNLIYTIGLFLVITMDFAILLLPVPILRHLTLRWYQKLVIAIVLSFGGTACIISILRFTSIRASTQSKDITWDKFYSAFYGAIEVNTGIICSCIVTLRPLFHRHFPFLVRWLDDFGDRHVSLATWKKPRRTGSDQPIIEDDREQARPQTGDGNGACNR